VTPQIGLLAPRKKGPSNTATTSISQEAALVTGSPFKRQVEESVARYWTLKANVKIEDKDKGKLVH
jgi:hypothetical protein